jgi:hypothetical protein
MAKLVFVYHSAGAPLGKLKLFLPAGTTFEFFDPAVKYPADTVFYYDMYGPGHEHIVTHLEQGYRVIFDAKNEHYIQYYLLWVLYSFLQHPGQGCFIISGHEPNPLPGIKIIATPYWYWIMDQMQLRNTGVDNIAWTSSEFKKKFFMSLDKQRVERDYVFDSLGYQLRDSVHSYRSRGIHLPDDYHDPVLQQRYINPDWMHTTAFTLAVETYVDETLVTGYSLTLKNHLFLCEKSYKPLAAQHPMMMIGTPGNLAYLRGQGFETFPELFDESYDNVLDWKQRVQHIVQQVVEFDRRSVDQPSVIQKLRHNQARFFDRTVTADLAYRTIQQPMFEFIDAQA